MGFFYLKICEIESFVKFQRVASGEMRSVPDADACWLEIDRSKFVAQIATIADIIRTTNTPPINFLTGSGFSLTFSKKSKG